MAEITDPKQIDQTIKEGGIRLRTIIEVGGNEESFIDEVLKKMIEKIKTDEEDIYLLKAKLSKPEKVKDQEIFIAFAECELLCKDMNTLSYLAFEYQPSNLEIIEPDRFQINSKEFSDYINDFQAKMHENDAKIKNASMKIKILNNNAKAILINFVTFLLSRNNLSSEVLSKITGIKLDALEDTLDEMIDKGFIELDGENYKLKKKEE